METRPLSDPLSLHLDLEGPLPEEAFVAAQAVEIVARVADAPRLEQVLLDLRTAKHLKSLCLRSELTALPPALTELTSLQHLEIEDPVLPGLPSAIDRLTRLRSLRLETLHLASLPKTIGSLHKLRALYVDSNHLRRLPSRVQELQDLRSLTLLLRTVYIHDWENPVTLLPRFEQSPTELFTLLAALPLLSSLSLAEPPHGYSNQPIFHTLPPELASLQALETLTLTDVMGRVHLPLGTPGIERLRKLVAVFTRFDHAEEDLRAALPDTEIVTGE